MIGLYSSKDCTVMKHFIIDQHFLSPWFQVNLSKVILHYYVSFKTNYDFSHTFL